MEEYQLEHPLTYISLFSGIGGFEIGINKVFPNAQCLGYSEIDPKAIKVYRSHFPDHPALGDVTRIKGTRFKGKVDLLVGGSPCQDFSSLGSGKGLKGKKSGLFLHYVRLLEEIKPRHFILENVCMKKQDQDMVSAILGVEPVLIDSNVVSYQRRKRLYWCSFDIKSIAKLPKLNTCVGHVLLDPEDPLLNEVKWNSYYRPRTNQDQIMRAIVKNLDHPQKSFYQLVRYTDKATGTITANLNGHICVDMGSNSYRNFHPIELERLQTFPDNWTDAVQFSDRKFLIGNAVTCDVISLIVSLLDLYTVQMSSYDSNRILVL